MFSCDAVTPSPLGARFAEQLESAAAHVVCREAGKMIKEKGFKFDVVYTSVLKRCVHIR